MNKISTGHPSTLKTYRVIAEYFGEKATAFIDQKMAESPKGEDEEVLAAEGQMLNLLNRLRNDETPPTHQLNITGSR